MRSRWRGANERIGTQLLAGDGFIGTGSRWAVSTARDSCGVT